MACVEDVETWMACIEDVETWMACDEEDEETWMACDEEDEETWMACDEEDEETWMACVEEDEETWMACVEDEETWMACVEDEETWMACIEDVETWVACGEEDVETWMACDEEDCGFQMLNDDEIVISVEENSDPVDDETDEDEDNNNNESSKGQSNTDAFCALETAMEWYEQQSAVLLNYYCSRESETLQRTMVYNQCTMVYEIHHIKGLDVCLSLAIALSTTQVTVEFGLIPPKFEGETRRVVRGFPPLFPFHKPLDRNLQIDGYSEYPHPTKALYVYEHPCLIRDSNPGPTAQQLASLTTIQDG
ncbi:hypothetical protein TNCV_2517631 [Trichonephila clavipes]|nr:hypothetical protein TNCV_2517631 [Trichonephila clavipes]